ncbi:hypothetical protein [Rhodococcus sp. B7740]|uniref:hypothetical protein n=1 Tax=Rhodococcus sp. B7740 TaxID=1564114 RepID=UPI000ABB4A47|nr:hypothetical protein [Rhodococcus sp. B7740]
MSRLSEDALLVAFAAAWEPYGGADAADVFVQFGIGLNEYRDRLNRTLTREMPSDMTADLHRRLLRYAAGDPEVDRPRRAVRRRRNPLSM